MLVWAKLITQPRLEDGNPLHLLDEDKHPMEDGPGLERTLGSIGLSPSMSFFRVWFTRTHHLNKEEKISIVWKKPLLVLSS
jgi:hypothetical protein